MRSAELASGCGLLRQRHGCLRGRSSADTAASARSTLWGLSCQQNLVGNRTSLRQPDLGERSQMTPGPTALTNPFDAQPAPPQPVSEPTGMDVGAEEDPCPANLIIVWHVTAA